MNDGNSVCSSYMMIVIWWLVNESHFSCSSINPSNWLSLKMQCSKESGDCKDNICGRKSPPWSSTSLHDTTFQSYKGGIVSNFKLNLILMLLKILMTSFQLFIIIWTAFWIIFSISTFTKFLSFAFAIWNLLTIPPTK